MLFSKPRISVKQFQCIQNCLTHVEIFAICQSSHKCDIFLLFCHFLILIVDLFVLKVNGIYWGLMQQVFVLDNMCKVIFRRRMIAYGYGLKIVCIPLDVFKVQGAIFQFGPSKVWKICIKINTQMVVDVVNQVRLVCATGGLSGSCLVISLVAKMHLVDTCSILCMREGILIAPYRGVGCEIC